MNRTDGRRWAYTGAILGVCVSIAANIAHSFVPPEDHPAGAEWKPAVGYVISSIAWPVFAYIGIEVLARVDWSAIRYSRLLRWAGVLPVAAVAAVASYTHMAGLLTHYGDDDLIVKVGPLAVDGTMLICTVVLIATGRTAPPERAPVQEVAAPVEEVARPAQEVPRVDRARWVDRAGRAPLPIVAQSPPRTAQAAHRALLPVVAHLPAQPEPPRVPTISLPPRTAPRTNGHRVLAPARTPTGGSRAPRARTTPRTQPRTPRGGSASDDTVREAVTAHRAAHPRDDDRATARAVKTAHPDTSARALGRALGCSDSTVRAYLKES